MVLKSDMDSITPTEVKVYNVRHATPLVDRGLILLPIGVYYNREIQTARVGEFILLMGETKPRKMRQICKLPLDSPVATFMCRYLYRAKLKTVINRWRLNAFFDGYNKTAVSSYECLMIEYETEDRK